MRRFSLIAMIVAVSAWTLLAGNNWLHIYQNITSFKSFDLSEIALIRYLKSLPEETPDENPENPETPENPENPDTPENPETPENPDENSGDNGSEEGGDNSDTGDQGTGDTDDNGDNTDSDGDTDTDTDGDTDDNGNVGGEDSDDNADSDNGDTDGDNENSENGEDNGSENGETSDDSSDNTDNNLDDNAGNEGDASEDADGNQQEESDGDSSDDSSDDTAESDVDSGDTAEDGENEEVVEPIAPLSQDLDVAEVEDADDDTTNDQPSDNDSEQTEENEEDAEIDNSDNEESLDENEGGSDDTYLDGDGDDSENSDDIDGDDNDGGDSEAGENGDDDGDNADGDSEDLGDTDNIGDTENGSEDGTEEGGDSETPETPENPDDTDSDEPEDLGYSYMEITDLDGNVQYIDMATVDSCVVKAQVPIINITLTDYPEMTELVSKDTYLNATLSVKGNGYCADIENQVLQIKGRGNTSWNKPKKPYRLKASKKFSLCGLGKAKSYALIANYIDPTLMHNTVAFWIADRLNMPYTNHSVPAMVYLNGDFKGAYMVTEKLGINAGSVDIDETKGMLFEMDAYYDEDYRFMYSWSTRYRSYNVPVMVKDPDLTEIAAELYPDGSVTADDIFEQWKNDFTQFADALISATTTTDISQFIDLESAVNYMMVCCICANKELNHPKSVFLYKNDIDDVYHMGPVWDFDWAFSYNGSQGLTQLYNSRLLSANGTYSGYSFFLKICQNTAFKALFKEKFLKFVEEDYPALVEYIDEYADFIESSAKLNGLRWPTTSLAEESSFDFRTHIQNLKTWLDNRINFMLVTSNYAVY